MFKAIALSLLASTAFAHYSLDFPKSRGFVPEIEPQFCGGFPNAGERQPFPLVNGTIRVNSHHTLATVWAFIATKPNPQSMADFNTTADGTSIPLLTDAFQGSRCWHVDFEKLNVGLKNGSEITLQLQYDGGDSKLYQCSDLVLLSDYKVPQNETCAEDAVNVFKAGGGSASAAPSSSGAAAGASGASGSGSAPSGSASSAAPSKPAGSASRGAVAVSAAGVVALVVAQAVVL